VSTATLTRRKATRTKRGRPAADEYPLPFRELPKRLQERALESFRNSEQSNDWDSTDSEDLTENLVNDLAYEFGLEVSTRVRQSHNGKTYSEPQLYWDNYHRTVEFQADLLDLEKVLKHADPEIFKTEGETAYQPSIAALKETLDLAEKAANIMGIAVSWTLRLRCGRDEYHLAEYSVDYSLWDDADPGEAMDAFVEPLEANLKDIYEDACARVLKIIDGEMDWRASDEYLRDTLENNDCFEFDEEGNLA
jgi:hypothetical protein